MNFTLPKLNRDLSKEKTRIRQRITTMNPMYAVLGSVAITIEPRHTRKAYLNQTFLAFKPLINEPSIRGKQAIAKS
jgi:hypothetical protein